MPEQKYKKKVFVVTSGTVAANVGQELIRQVDEHLTSELQVLVRSLDTARLNQRRTIRDGEWKQMTIDQKHMRAIHQERHTKPHLASLLYDDLLPFTTGVGASRIRYNGAGAIAVNHDSIKQWLSGSISTLSRSKGSTALTFAIIVSSVGATGSGSVQRLIELLAEAAANATIDTPINCDIFIMLPESEGVDALGLANTFSLFAELAAARLSRSHTDTENFQGRIILVGWGKTRSMKSIAQLEEATATIVRLINDPATEFAGAYEDSRADHHVLRELDEMTLLPTHLSSVTAVTISLGTLEEQIVERNTATLISHLVFGNETIPDDTFFLETLANSMRGETPEEQHESLLDYLAASIRLNILRPTIEAEATGHGIPDPKAWLSQKWLADKGNVDRRAADIEQTGRTLAKGLITTWKRMQFDGIITSSARSLSSLTRSYQQLRERLSQILRVAQEPITFKYPNDEVNRSLSAVNTQGRGGEVPRKENDRERPGLIRAALSRVRQNVIDYRDQKANPTALSVLRDLLNEADRAYRDLAIVFTRLNAERARLEAVADQRLFLGSDHMLEIPALSDERDSSEERDQDKLSEIDQYYQQISPFTQSETLHRMTDEGLVADDPYLEFRRWLGDDPDREEHLFKGDIELLRQMVRNYIQDVVAKQVKKNNVLDILLRDRGVTLRQRLREAAEVAYPLINYNDKFAPSERKEKLYVCAYWDNDKKRGELQLAVEEAFGQGRCTLLPAKDPTEIVIFYYIDGISMAAISDLTGRCYDAFLQQRKRWLDQRKDNPTQNIGIPVYSGKDAEERVRKQDIICKLNKAAQKDLCQYGDLPETLNCTGDC